MSFLWPTRQNPDPRIAARMGQLIHYVGLVTALLLFWAFANPNGPGNALDGLVFAAPIYLVARGLRYALAGE